MSFHRVSIRWFAEATKRSLWSLGTYTLVEEVGGKQKYKMMLGWWVPKVNTKLGVTGERVTWGVMFYTRKSGNICRVVEQKEEASYESTQQVQRPQGRSMFQGQASCQEVSYRQKPELGMDKTQGRGCRQGPRRSWYWLWSPLIKRWNFQIANDSH